MKETVAINCIKTRHLIVLLNLKKEIYTYDIFSIAEIDNNGVMSPEPVYINDMDWDKIMERIKRKQYILIPNGEIFIGWECKMFYDSDVKLFRDEILENVLRIMNNSQ